MSEISGLTRSTLQAEPLDIEFLRRLLVLHAEDDVVEAQRGERHVSLLLRVGGVAKV